MHDHHWLYNAPSCNNAVQWSEDNHLAVAAAHTVVILNPGYLNGARGFAVTPEGVDLSALQVDGVPNQPECSAQAIWSVTAEVNSAADSQRKGQIRSLSWSPAGCTQQAGCFLSTVSADNKVRLYCAPARGLGCEWPLAMDVTEFLKEQLANNNWQVLDALAVARVGGTDNDVLRLRGGAGTSPVQQCRAAQYQQPSLQWSVDAEEAQAQHASRQQGAEGDCDDDGVADDALVLRLRGGGGPKRKAPTEQTPNKKGGAGTAAVSEASTDAASKRARTTATAGSSGHAALDDQALSTHAEGAHNTSTDAADAVAAAAGTQRKSAVSAPDDGPLVLDTASVGAVPDQAVHASTGTHTDVPAVETTQQLQQVQDDGPPRDPRLLRNRNASRPARAQAQTTPSNKAEVAGTSVAAGRRTQAASTVDSTKQGPQAASRKQEHKAARGGGQGLGKLLGEGSLVEVQVDEEGLKGCWFTGQIVQMHKGWALVQYDELLEESGTSAAPQQQEAANEPQQEATKESRQQATKEEGTKELQQQQQQAAIKLREWFPLTGARKVEAEAGRLPTEHIWHWGPGAIVRPVPPQQMQRRGQVPLSLLQPNCVVEVFSDDGWWLAVVSEAPTTDGDGSEALLPPDTQLKITMAGQQEQVLNSNVRVPCMWENNQWIRTKFVGHPHPPSPTPTPTPSSQTNPSPAPSSLGDSDVKPVAKAGTRGRGRAAPKVDKAQGQEADQPLPPRSRRTARLQLQETSAVEISTMGTLGVNTQQACTTAHESLPTQPEDGVCEAPAWPVGAVEDSHAVQGGPTHLVPAAAAAPLGAPAQQLLEVAAAAQAGLEGDNAQQQAGAGAVDLQGVPAELLTDPAALAAAAALQVIANVEGQGTVPGAGGEAVGLSKQPTVVQPGATPLKARTATRLPGLQNGSAKASPSAAAVKLPTFKLQLPALPQVDALNEVAARLTTYNLADTPVDCFKGLVPNCDVAVPEQLAGNAAQLVVTRFRALREQLPHAPRYANDRDMLHQVDVQLLQRAAKELVHLYGPMLQQQGVGADTVQRSAGMLARRWIMSREQELRRQQGGGLQAEGDTSHPTQARPGQAARAGRAVRRRPATRKSTVSDEDTIDADITTSDGSSVTSDLDLSSPGVRGRGRGKGRGQGARAQTRGRGRAKGRGKGARASSKASSGMEGSEDWEGEGAVTGGKTARSKRKEAVELPEYDVKDTPPFAFAQLVPDCDVGISEQVARYASQLVTKRFLVLRADLPQLPRYQDREPIKPLDSHNLHRAINELVYLYGDALAAHGIDQKILLRNARALARHYIMKEESRLREAEAADGDNPSMQLARTSSAARPINLPAYDASQTDPNTFVNLAAGINIDYSDEALARAAHNLVFKRFLVLRGEIDPSQLPTYEKAERMREPDTSLLARAWAELKHVYGARLQGHMDEKKVLKRVRSMVRVKVIGTRAYWRSDMNMMYEPTGSGMLRSPTPFGSTADGSDLELLSGEASEDDLEGDVQGGPSSAARSKRARRAVKYTDDVSSEGSQGAAGASERASKGTAKRKRTAKRVEDEGSTDEYRASEDEAIRGRSQVQREGGEISSDEISLVEEADITQADDGVDEDEVYMLHRASGRGGRGARRGRGAARSSGGTSTGGGRRVSGAGRSTAGDGSTVRAMVSAGAGRGSTGGYGIDGGWRSRFNFSTGVPLQAFNQLPYQVFAVHGKQQTRTGGIVTVGPHFRLVMSKGKKRARSAACGPEAKLKVARGRYIDNAAYDARILGLAALHTSWSPTCVIPNEAAPTCVIHNEAAPAEVGTAARHGSVEGEHATGNGDAVSDQHGTATRCCLLAVCTKSGLLHMLRYNLPQQYCLTATQPLNTSDTSSDHQGGANTTGTLTYLGAVHAHCQPTSFVTCCRWLVVGSGSAAEASSRWHINTPRQALAGERLLLVTGGGDGSIHLWGTSCKQACQSAAAWQLLHTITPPDSMSVTCIDMALSEPDSTGSRRLLVAVGKPCGALVVYRSGPVQSSSDLETAVAAPKSRCWLSQGCHGLHTVTGVSLQPWSHSRTCPGETAETASWQLLTSTGLDGGVRCWRVTGQGLQAAGEPQRFNPASAFNAPRITASMPTSSRPAYGVSASPNGLLLAVTRTTGVFQEEIDMGGSTSKMTWARVAAGSIHLYTTWGPDNTPPAAVNTPASGHTSAANTQANGGASAANTEGNGQASAAITQTNGQASTAITATSNKGGVAPCGPLMPLLPRLSRQLCLQWPVAACMWDLAAAVVMAAWQPVPLPKLPPQFLPAGGRLEDDEDVDDEDGPGKIEDGGAPLDSRRDIEMRQVTQAIKYLAVLKQCGSLLEVAAQAARLLEAPHAQESVAGSPDEGTPPLSRISSAAWQGLHAATVLRRLVLNYLDAHQQLAKALGVLQPLLHHPSGEQPAMTLQQAQQHAAVHHLLPSWLFETATQRFLETSEPAVMSLLLTLKELKDALNRNELELLQLHVWRSLGGPSEPTSSLGGPSNGILQQATGLAAILGPRAAALQAPGQALNPAKTAAGPTAVAAAAAAPGSLQPALWQQLMADWVVNCLQPEAKLVLAQRPEQDVEMTSVEAQPQLLTSHPYQHVKELLPLAQKVQALAQNGGCMDVDRGVCREASATLGVPVSMQGSSISAARGVELYAHNGQWHVVDKPQQALCTDSATDATTGGAVAMETDIAATAGSGSPQGAGVASGSERNVDQHQSGVTAPAVALVLPRCAASFQLCEADVTWHCPACQRRYNDPPTFRCIQGLSQPTSVTQTPHVPNSSEALLPDVPYCVICSVRLGAAAVPSSFLPAPAVQLQPIPPEPIVVP